MQNTAPIYPIIAQGQYPLYPHPQQQPYAFSSAPRAVPSFPPYFPNPAAIYQYPQPAYSQYPPYPSYPSSNSSSSSSSGPRKTLAMVAEGKGERLVLKEIELPALKDSQVELAMEYCGLCHTDIHMVNDDWGISSYPMVAGHEGVGVVTQVGRNVQGLRVGDRCGVGWIRDSCGKCANCAQGRENLCLGGYQGTYLGEKAGVWGKSKANSGGCFAKTMRIEEKFAFKIPANIHSVDAAPLLCAGATVYEPLCDYIFPGSSIAVVGCGGLGTLALKLTKIRGASTIAIISRSIEKKERALSAGANEFILASEVGNDKYQGKFDIVLDTTPVNDDIDKYMGIVKFNGSYCRIGIPSAANQKFSFNWIPLIFTQKKVAGSIVCGSLRTNHLLATCACNTQMFTSTKPPKVVDFANVNEAFQEVLDNKMDTFRIVLKW